MIIQPGFVGIDIAKLNLDIFDGARAAPERVANAPEAIASVIARWKDKSVFVLFEATGAYDRHLRQALSDAAISFARVNPARARDFARATGTLAKTDAIDAKMLAAMAQSLRPAPQPKACPQRETLAFLHKRRDQLVAMRQEERARLEGCIDATVKADINDHVQSLAARIDTLQERIDALIESTPVLKNDARLLRSIPGIGPVAAATLLALMPELGQRSPKTIAALAGLAPFNVDSGQFRGQRAIKGGRRRVRQALYMSAVTAARSHSRYANLYRKLIDAGKPAKRALIAIARKILIAANAIVRDQTPFKP